MRGAKNDNYDLNQIIVRPLYFGLVANVLIPMAGLFVCYYVNNNYGYDNIVGDLANPLFYIFGVLALLHGALTLWWRTKRLNRPMTTTVETFEKDIAAGFLRLTKPVFIVIAAISIYGYLYFFLTGRFRETAAFVFLSFIVFQLVRPRQALARKVIARQKELLGQKQSLSD